MSEHFDPHDPQRIEALRMQVNQLIDTYLNQKPRPGISEFAEAFGAGDYITQLKRQKAIKVDVKAFKDEMVSRLIERSTASGVEVKLPQIFEILEQTFLPPDEGELLPGSGEGKDKKKYIPRTQYLIDLLSTMNESYEIIGGKNTSDMMRECSYFIFFLQNSKKALFVNNEEGNTTFIMYEVNSKQEAVNLAALTKDEIRAKELHTHPYAQIDWTGDEESWKGKIHEFLSGPMPENTRGEKLVIEDVCKDVETSKVEEYEKIKEDEMTVKMISKHIGKSEGWVIPHIKKLLIEHPDWAPQIRLVPGGSSNSLQKVLCYRPELIAELKHQVESLKKPRERWLNLFSISEKIGKDRGWARPRIEELLVTHPEWKPEIGLDRINKEVLFYPPSLVEALELEAKKLEKSSEKDLNIKDISIKLKKSTMWVDNHIKKLLSEHPELAPKSKSLNKGNREIFFYSPEVLVKLQEEVEELKEGNENWITIVNLSKEIGRSQNWIKARINKLTTDHPEWEPEILLETKSKRPSLHYPVEVMAELKKMSETETK